MTPDINSYSFIICDGILQRLREVPTFKSVMTFARNRMRIVQPQNLPYLGCYLVDETLTSDGDPDAGEPRFIHAVRIGFSVIIRNNDPDIAERNLDSAHWTIMNLLTAQRWHRFPMPPPFDDVQIEGISRGSRRHVFGAVGLNNETPIAELQMDLTMTHRTSFRPVVTDDLKLIHVTVAYPWPYDPAANEPFTVQYDLPQ